jgi:uncharacterized protein
MLRSKMLSINLARIAECSAEARILAGTVARTIASLDEEREFLRRANVGSESMKPEDQQRGAAIIADEMRRWAMTLRVLKFDFLSADERSSRTCPSVPGR